jgi:hypothetical protein
MLIHLDEGIKGRPPEYVRPEQFIDFEYVFLTISERRTRSRARSVTLFDNFPRNGAEADAPSFDDDHIERSVDDSFIWDSIAFSRVQTFVKDRDGDCAFGLGLIDPTKGVQKLGTERNVVGPWLTSASKKGVVRMVAGNAGQLRMWEVEIVEGNQRHGKVVGRRDQFVPEH